MSSPGVLLLVDVIWTPSVHLFLVNTAFQSGIVTNSDNDKVNFNCIFVAIVETQLNL